MQESYKGWNKGIKDQAYSLRMTDFTQNRRGSSGITRVISFTSGKGGVGKTSTVCNFAISLARMGRSVLVLDADLGLANVDVMLGLTPKATLNDVLEGNKSLNEVIIDGPEGIAIIPAASGIESICNLSHQQRYTLMHAVEEVAGAYDYLLIDTRAGISPDVLHFNCAANEIVCVITAEPTSLTDAYALIKILARNYSEKCITILANNVGAGERGSSETEAQRAYQRLLTSVNRFLKKEQVELRYLGFIPSDSHLPEAIKQQTAVVQIYPSSPASLAISAAARRMDEEFLDHKIKGGMQFFFQQLMETRV